MKTPESLYTRYRSNRGESPEGFVNSTELTESLADEVYSAYRKNRISDREASIDAIMDALNSVEQTNAMSANVDENTHGKSLLGDLFRLPGRLIDRLTGKSGITRYAMPAFAAALAALLIVPFFTAQPDSVSGVPVSLIEHAASVTPHIDTSTIVELGFAGTSSDDKKAFNRGILAVDLVMVAKSGQRQTLEKVVRNILGIAETENQMLLAEAATLYMKKGGDLEEVQKQLAAAPTGEDVDRWYDQGKSIESIVLSAEFAIRTSNFIPLNDALSGFVALDISGLNQPSIRIITELRKIDPTQALSLKDARKARDSANDIKILMR